MALLLTGASLVDGTGAPAKPQADILVDGDRIHSVGGATGTYAGDARTVDLTGHTLLPGLIDAHSHLGLALRFDDLVVEGRVPAAVIAAEIFRNLSLALDSGFTTVREVGGLDGGVAEAVRRGLVRGPEIRPSGPLLCQTGGHSSFQTPYGIFDDHHHSRLRIPGLVQVSVVCDGADEVRRAARQAFRAGATQIKVCASGGVVSLSDDLSHTQFTVEEITAAVDEARARDTYVAVHAHNARAVRLALAAGVHSIEHGTFLDEAAARQMAAAGAVLVPTLAVARLMREEWRSYGLTEEIAARMEGVEEAMQRSMLIARDAGVTIASGSDLIGPAQRRRGLEVVLKSQSLGAMEAIVSATSVNARLLGLHERLGTVEVGKQADLVAVRGDVLAHPELLDDPGNVTLVVKAGRIVKDLLPAPVPAGVG
jgi:imidazolonepropionase-like amidohydrolase